MEFFLVLKKMMGIPANFDMRLMKGSILNEVTIYGHLHMGVNINATEIP